MAERPVFVPSQNTPGLVKVISCKIVWNSGFSAVQKKKNIRALHEAAAIHGLGPLLEASTKSDEKLGQHLSAFHLQVISPNGKIPLECAYQGSKVFENGGPYTDLYNVDVRSAKRDPRLRDSGKLLGFRFFDFDFPLEPKTIFYDWLYINAIYPHREWLSRLSQYAGFTDIEFNPLKSLNCQARSCALFVSLMKLHLLDDAVTSPEGFMKLIERFTRNLPGQNKISKNFDLFAPNFGDLNPLTQVSSA